MEEGRKRKIYRNSKNIYRLIRAIWGEETSDRQIAQRLEMDTKSLYKLKYGKSPVPRVERLSKLAGSLGVRERVVFGVARGLAPAEALQLQRELDYGKPHPADRDYQQLASALNETEEKYKNLFEISPAVILVEDMDGNIVSVNKKGCRIYGYSKEEMLALNVRDIVPPDLSRNYPRLIGNLRRSGPLFFESRALRKDGEVFPCNLTASLVRLSGEDYVQIIIEDITEFRRIEGTLRDSEEKYRSLFEISSAAILQEDLEGNIIAANKRCRDIYGYSHREILKLTVRDIAPPELAKNYPRLIENLRKLGPLTFESRALRKNGEVFPCALSASLVTIGGREYALIAIDDISDQKQAAEALRKAEEELRKAQKLESVGILAGGIAHDFNNILAAILGNVSLARTLISPESEVAGLLANAEMSSLRARALTDQLLTFSRGGVPIRKTITLEKILTESSRFALHGSNVACSISIEDDLRPVEVDEGQIGQVLNNLIINADQAMPDGGTIELQAENVTVRAGEIPPLSGGRYVKISVADRGTGIPEKYLTSIFDPFFTTKQNGSGLGLAVCYSIIKKHDGAITIDSRDDRGTIFNVYLPAVIGQPVQEKERGEELVFGRGRILLMDNEAEIRKVVVKMLVRLGYSAEVAPSGDLAVTIYQEAMKVATPFDAVILDLTIPGGMGGRETLARLKAIDPGVKALVSSGYAEDPILSEYRKEGFRGIIAKPYTIGQLSRQLKRVIEEVE